MTERRGRGCHRCGAEVPETDLSCPTCGKFFEGGFELGDLIEGIRTLQPDLPAPAEGPDDNDWRPPVPSASAPDGPTFHGLHRIRLPEVGPVADLPYASDDHAGGSAGDVIDLRDRGDRHRPARPWGRRSRTRT